MNYYQLLTTIYIIYVVLSMCLLKLTVWKLSNLSSDFRSRSDYNSEDKLVKSTCNSAEFHEKIRNFLVFHIYSKHFQSFHDSKD